MFVLLSPKQDCFVQIFQTIDDFLDLRCHDCFIPGAQPATFAERVPIVVGRHGIAAAVAIRELDRELVLNELPFLQGTFGGIRDQTCQVVHSVRELVIDLVPDGVAAMGAEAPGAQVPSAARNTR